MAKPMTKARIVAALAEKVGISKKTAEAFLQSLAAMAYKEAKNGFTLPGLGKIVLRTHEARRAVNPRTQQPMTIPRRKRLRFVVAKAAKDAVLGGRK